jgi:SAM-dependent methyltransferase
MGTANLQSQLWGARAREWAELQEGTVAPLYKAVLHKTTIGVGTTLLDIGCGAGMFCQMATQRGAQVTGLDATPELLAIARERVPQGAFRIGELEALPYADNTFDVVTGFNAFQFAADPANALGEAKRVARSGVPVVIAIWGKEEDCEAAGYFVALGALLPPAPLSTAGPWALSQPGALEALVSQAGLTPTAAEEVDCPWVYPDEATALRALLSAGPAVRAIQQAGESAVRAAVAKAIAPLRTASGGYELRNKFRYLICRG